MHKIDELVNGVKTITVPMQGTKTATVLVIVGTGSKYENKKNNGISHFLEHMFFKGTTKRPNTQVISNELDSLGAEFNAFTGKEYTGYWVKAEAEKIEKAMDIISDMLLNSKFDTTEINQERGVIIEEINMKQDNPMYSVEDIFENCLYGNTPAGWDIIGTKENIVSFKRKDFTDYFSSQYGAHSITVCLAGNIGKGKKYSEFLSKYFSDKRLKERDSNFEDKVKVNDEQKKPAVILSYKKTDQAHISLGVRTFGYDHKDKLIVKMLSIILGGSMSSRLFINLRERKGLAYYVRTDAEHYTDTGYLTTIAGVPLNKINEAIRTIVSTYKKIGLDVKSSELKRAKDLLRGRMAINLEASDSQASWYARQAVMLRTINRTAKNQNDINKNINTPEELIKKIDSIKLADIKRIAKKIFVNKNLNFVAIGPYKEEKEFEGLLKL